ncbi:MAG TPA: hypothetical protein VEB22_15210 [Phycisphaerales bacterium]|nr:hypothetical protein [Phycisphaerales bacterium]
MSTADLFEAYLPIAQRFPSVALVVFRFLLANHRRLEATSPEE